jgi:DNA-binding NarL/FixJ family response regulator
MMKFLLESHPDWHVCAEATNGQESAQKAAELKPDIIILDFAMPVMDGLRAARQILSASPDTPIILHTQYAFSPLIAEAKKIGIRQVLDKATAGDRLLSEVESLVNSRPDATPDADRTSQLRK